MRYLSALVFLILSCASVAMAQKNDERALRKNDWWIGTSIGVTHSLAENATSDDFMKNYPGAELQLGTFVSRTLGFRLSMGLNPQLGRPGQAQREGDPEVYDTHYRFNVLNAYFDGLVDLTTLFTSKRKKYRPTFDMILFAGGGMLEAFHFDYEKVANWTYYPVNPWDKTYWGAHAGLLASYRISPHWDWMLEGSYNITDSRYDGVDSGVALSGYVKLHTGWVYHFNDRTSKNVRLRNEIDDSWQPGYTQQDRMRAKKVQEKRLAEARKNNERFHKEKIKREEERNKAVRQERKRQESMTDETPSGKSYEGPGNWFFGFDIGSTMAMAENVNAEDFMKTEIPSGSIRLGRTMTPWAGLQLTVGNYSQLGHASQVAVKYEPKTYTPYRYYTAVGTMDLMLNLTNMCRKYDARNWFDAYLMLGGGVLYSYGFDKKVDDWDPEVYPVNSAELMTWTGKAGLMGAWHVSNGWDLTTSLDLHATENAYNGVVDREDRSMDFFLSLRIGMTYYFGNRKGRHRYGNRAVVHKYWK